MRFPNHPSIASGIRDHRTRLAMDEIDQNLALLAKMIPVGSVIMSLIQPEGAVDPWLFADGRAVDRKTYSELFKIIGEQYGAGDGATTFVLPDMRDKILYGTPEGSTSNVDTGQTEATSQSVVSDATAGDSSATVTVSSFNRFYVTPLILGR